MKTPLLCLIILLLITHTGFTRSQATHAGAPSDPVLRPSRSNVRPDKSSRSADQKDKNAPCPQAQADASGRWYIYKDFDENSARTNHGEWSNYMPKEASEMIKINFVDATSQAVERSATAIRVDINFAPPALANTKGPGWCGLAVASEANYWGETPGGRCYDLSKATKLVFHARGEKGSEKIRVKVAITVDKDYGDSAKQPADTGWIFLKDNWKQYELQLKGYDLSRVITPFVFSTDASMHDAQTISFFLDEIYFELGSGSKTQK